MSDAKWLAHLAAMQAWHANEAATHPNPLHRALHAVRASDYASLILELP